MEESMSSIDGKVECEGCIDFRSDEESDFVSTDAGYYCIACFVGEICVPGTREINHCYDMTVEDFIKSREIRG
tara:strand:+ start:2131 stop:2349 length:219 start_codon:yes stop_codon:yes gene_type:complete